ncbi:hypothetical protein PTKIN_Ptkin06aG0063700 [Pterospermum kingtungense]
MEDMPPGFRFYPTEEELVSFYLRSKLEGNREDLNHLMNRVIPDVDIYEFNPWDLPQFSLHLCHKDPEQWFFFVPRQESEARGGRPRRLTTTGYWKATGSPSFVYSSGNRPIGVKRTMVFYKGRAPNGRKTDWKMNEYKAIDEEASSCTGATATPTLRDEFSLCRVYKKLKCLRSFDRRPPPAAGVEIHEPVPHRQGQDVAEIRAMSSQGSSSSGDDGNPSQSSNLSAMAVDHDDLFCNLDEFWDSILK